MRAADFCFICEQNQQKFLNVDDLELTTEIQNERKKIKCFLV